MPSEQTTTYRTSAQRHRAFAHATLATAESEQLSFTVVREAPDGEVILTVEERDFVELAARFAARYDHMHLGLIALLADAQGIEVVGDYHLIDAQDQNLCYWPSCSMSFARCVWALLRQPNAYSHAGSLEKDLLPKGGIIPVVPMADLPAYINGRPQEAPGWLPMVLCFRLEGIGAQMRHLTESQYNGLTDPTSRRTLIETALNRIFSASDDKQA